MFRRKFNDSAERVVSPRLTMLVIADVRPDFGDRALADVVEDQGVDLVITAGDLHRTDIAGIDQLPVPTLGVYGNHCDGRYLADLRMTNLHLRCVELNGLRFTGLEGCVRYKDGTRDALYTQSEYSAMLAELPRADVLVTHCPPAGVNDHPGDEAHAGIEALRRWVDRTSPTMLIHGHTYPRVPVTRYGATRVEYVRGARVMTL